MSPSEFDLRAALREGEGDGLDPDRVIARGVAHRAQRRSRLINTAAAVVLVAGLGVGGAALIKSGDSGSGSSSSAGGARAASSSGSSAAAGGQVTKSDQSAGAREPVAAAPTAAARAVPGCPAEYPRTLLPTGSATKSPLFAEPVLYAVVCSYGPPTAATVPSRIVLVGARAADLVSRLEHASLTFTPRPCPTVLASRRSALAIIGVTAAGTRLPVVTTVVDSSACNLQATNGIAVRYDWKPPADLLGELEASTTGTAAGSPAPPGASGSPVR